MTLEIMPDFTFKHVNQVDEPTFSASDLKDHLDVQARDIRSWLNSYLVPEVATSRANLLTNGGFEIWQRGAGPFTAHNAYTADRWKIELAGTDTLQVDREGTTKKANSLYSAKCAFTLGTGAGATRLVQALKISDGYHHLLGKAVSIRVPSHCNAASALRIGVKTDGTGGATTYSGYHAGTSAFADLDTVNITVPSNATYIEIATYFAASCTAYLDNAMLVPGSIAADYMPLHPAEEMQRCQRYYELVGVAADNSIIISGYASAASQPFYFTLPFKVNKAVSPSISKNGTWPVVNCSQPTVDVPGLYAFRFSVASDAGGIFRTENNATNCNFTVEANP